MELEKFKEVFQDAYELLNWDEFTNIVLGNMYPHKVATKDSCEIWLEPVGYSEWCCDNKSKHHSGHEFFEEYDKAPTISDTQLKLNQALVTIKVLEETNSAIKVGWETDVRAMVKSGKSIVRFRNKFTKSIQQLKDLTVMNTDLINLIEKQKDKLDFIEAKGLKIGMMSTSDKDEPYLAYVIKDGSELCDNRTLEKLLDAELEIEKLKDIRASKPIAGVKNGKLLKCDIDELLILARVECLEHEKYHLKGMKHSNHEFVKIKDAAMYCSNSFFDGVEWVKIQLLNKG